MTKAAPVETHDTASLAEGTNVSQSGQMLANVCLVAARCGRVCEQLTVTNVTTLTR